MTSAPPDVEQLTDELMHFVGYLMKDFQQEAFRAAAELDLSLSQLRALFILGGLGEQALHELVPRIGLSVAATGRAVDVLVRNGLVDRREDPADRRVKRIALTPAGQEIIARVASARREGLSQLASGLDDEQRSLLSHALAPLLAASPHHHPHSSSPVCEGGAR